MGEEEEKNEEQKVDFTASDYLQNLDALRKATVSKEAYDKLLEDNKKLSKALAEGSFTEKEKEETIEISSEEAKKSLFDGKRKTDLELFTEALNLRDAVLREGGRDPFLHSDPEYIPTEQDKINAKRVADNIKEAIDYADGDPEIFRMELKRRTADQK